MWMAGVKGWEVGGGGEEGQKTPSQTSTNSSVLFWIFSFKGRWNSLVQTPSSESQRQVSGGADVLQVGNRAALHLSGTVLPAWALERLKCQRIPSFKKWPVPHTCIPPPPLHTKRFQDSKMQWLNILIWKNLICNIRCIHLALMASILNQEYTFFLFFWFKCMISVCTKGVLDLSESTEGL